MQQKHGKTLSGNSETPLSKYEIEMEIGRGSSGTCYRAFNKASKEIYAIKKIPINNLRVLLRKMTEIKRTEHFEGSDEIGELAEKPYS